MENASPQRKTIAFTCSCGAQEEISASLRGIEQSCAECGRIFRIPSVGDTLDLRIVQEEGKPDEVMQALQMLVGKENHANETSRTMVRLVFVILVLAIAAFAAYWLSR
ncbi:MAG: hypothetical protein KDB07_12715 [Planctomycetes bacterium]|nr:hypothetical protein [Planctomycetota bacterium]